jgi:RHH-type proline utilization regulon transcriptional repressor/proline dehydrogenase/delta 1-pyrroline-5-carboxylate dehydrogenase
LLDQINATGYGLTQGVHTRIDETIAQVVNRAHAGNVYVNRNMVGAVVGVQPFGGEGLSGTAPRPAGRCTCCACCRSARPMRWPAPLPTPTVPHRPTDAARPPAGPAGHLAAMGASQGNAALASTCQRFAQTQSGTARTLPGPTGERNVYTLAPRARVLCLAPSADDLLVQTAAVLASGGTALWPTAQASLRTPNCPPLVQAQVTAAGQRPATTAAGAGRRAAPWRRPIALQAVCTALAQRPGPIVGVTALQPGAVDIPLERLLIERALSVNTAAAGGNASLMTIG